MTHLRRLGFPDAAIFACHTLTTGQLLVPATIEGAAATLLLDTELRLDVDLHRHWVEARGLPYDPRDEDSGRATTGEFVALGRQREHAIANTQVARRAWWGDDGTHAGRMGVLFFRHGVLALDPAGPRIGFTTDERVRDWPIAPDVRVPLLTGVEDDMPFTRSVRLPSLRLGELTFLLDTGRYRSVLARACLERAANRKHAAEALAAGDELFATRLAIAEAAPVLQRFHIVDLEPDAYDLWGVAHVDGVLGMDYLRRQVTVFDLSRNTLLLWDYETIGDPERDAATLWSYVRGSPPPTAR